MTIQRSLQLPPSPVLSEELPRFLRRTTDDVRERQTLSDHVETKTRSTARLIVCVILPFAAGYFVSYLFRSINAVIAGPLVTTFDLSPAALGFMTSAYFLAFVILQLPLARAIDRFGPRRVQATLMLVAALGAAIFAHANSFPVLLIGRLLIGFGVAVALMTGLKAIVIWVPSERIALANGGLIMLGALGAVAATLPAATIIESYGWRRLCELLAILCALVAIFVFFAVPERPRGTKALTQRISLAHIYRDRRFWRIAPLSASIVATSWSLQGLWAAPWLSEVEGFAHSSVVNHLFAMAVGLSVGAMSMGIAADRLRRHGISAMNILATTGGLSIAAQLAIILRWPLPPILSWTTIAIAGAATVLSFASLSDLFPKECSARANAALNLLHVGGAFLLQFAIGFIVNLWPDESGQHPAEAYQVAFATILIPQIASLIWFLVGDVRGIPIFAAHPRHRSRHGPPSVDLTIYEVAFNDWGRRVQAARGQARSWRLAAGGSIALSLTLAGGLTYAIDRRDDGSIHVMNVGDISPRTTHATAENQDERRFQLTHLGSAYAPNQSRIQNPPFDQRADWSGRTIETERRGRPQ